MRRPAGVAFLLLSAIGCGKNGDVPRNSNEWTAERDSIGDTLIVRTVSGSTWGRPGRLVTRVSIGVADGDENLMLSAPRGLGIGPDGSIYVSDQGPALRRYGPDGRFIQKIGREGSGPGEYRSPDGGLAVLADGRVILRDPGNGRFAVYTADGQPLDTWRVRSGFNTGRRLYTDTLGNVYTLILIDPSASVFDWVMGLQRYAPDGTPGDSLRVPAWKYAKAQISGQRDGSSSINDVPFSPEASWAFSPLGYFVGGVSTSYRIDLFRPGSTLRIERRTSPVPVDPAEAEDRKRVETDNMVRNFPGWVWNGPDIPRTKPPFRQVYAGQDGRIWVLVSRPGVKDPGAAPMEGSGDLAHAVATWKEPVAFDVFDPDGRYLGEVTAPDGFQTYPEPLFRADTVWATVEDANGVRYIHRMEIEH
jgi:hypothetical protein